MATFGLSFDIVDVESDSVTSSGDTDSIYTVPTGKFAVAYFKAYEHDGAEGSNLNQIRVIRNDTDGALATLSSSVGFHYYTFGGASGARDVGFSYPLHGHPIGGNYLTSIDPSVFFPATVGGSAGTGAGLSETENEMPPILMYDDDVLFIVKTGNGAATRAQFKIFEWS